MEMERTLGTKTQRGPKIVKAWVGLLSKIITCKNGPKLNHEAKRLMSTIMEKIDQ